MDPSPEHRPPMGMLASALVVVGVVACFLVGIVALTVLIGVVPRHPVLAVLAFWGIAIGSVWNEGRVLPAGPGLVRRDTYTRVPFLWGPDPVAAAALLVVFGSMLGIAASQTAMLLLPCFGVALFVGWSVWRPEPVIEVRNGWGVVGRLGFELDTVVPCRVGVRVGRGAQARTLRVRDPQGLVARLAEAALDRHATALVCGPGGLATGTLVSWLAVYRGLGFAIARLARPEREDGPLAWRVWQQEARAAAEERRSLPAVARVAMDEGDVVVWTRPEWELWLAMLAPPLALGAYWVWLGGGWGSAFTGAVGGSLKARYEGPLPMALAVPAMAAFILVLFAPLLAGGFVWLRGLLWTRFRLDHPEMLVLHGDLATLHQGGHTERFARSDIVRARAGRVHLTLDLLDGRSIRLLCSEPAQLQQIAGLDPVAVEVPEVAAHLQAMVAGKRAVRSG
ncbi:MAG: hypothetical protein R3F61_25715 [Myxococcota bacterium]